MVGLAFSVAACANFPVLVLSMFWKGLTTRGAVIGGVIGLATVVTLIILSKAVWVDTLGISETPSEPIQWSSNLCNAIGVLLLLVVLSVTDNSARAQTRT